MKWQPKAKDSTKDTQQEPVAETHNNNSRYRVKEVQQTHQIGTDRAALEEEDGSERYYEEEEKLPTQQNKP